MRRNVMRDFQLRDKTLREGDKVVLWYNSANRDDAVFEEPYRFDVTRTETQVLSFGSGIHYCLGAPLARLEGEVAIGLSHGSSHNARA